jgi:hypothetical protein
MIPLLYVTAEGLLWLEFIVVDSTRVPPFPSGTPNTEPENVALFQSIRPSEVNALTKELAPPR